MGERSLMLIGFSWWLVAIYLICAGLGEWAFIPSSWGGFAFGLRDGRYGRRTA